MWIAKTTVTDGIAIVVFAMVLSLVLFGVVALVKWIRRLISGTTKMEAVLLVLESEFREDEEETEEHEDINNFALYLHSKLTTEKAGCLSDIHREDNELFLCFEGPDANRIWDLFYAEVKDYSPNKPMRVILNGPKKTGGKRVLDHIPWQPDRKLYIQTSPDVQIPQKWLRLSNFGRVLSTSGVLGLFGWNIIRMFRGNTENDFMSTGPGSLSAYLVGALLVSGLSLALICSIRIRALTKAAGFACKESPTSNTLKYVLLIVTTIIGLVLLSI